MGSEEIYSIEIVKLIVKRDSGADEVSERSIKIYVSMPLSSQIDVGLTARRWMNPRNWRTHLHNFHFQYRI